ncbi:MAG: phosphoenolpyruvate carboxylase [Erysipelotrichaceae bacterium]|nr:phosphoenolpyruvate carboxylase [Erysipelotrichaceae bacterium]
MRIPKTMSTQHPDNVNVPFFSTSPELGGEDEIQEAFYAYSHLHCVEQMWDAEGKEVDNYVVRKLLTKYESFFRKKTLGTDVFLTLRVPNPNVEKTEAKVLLETLEGIPRSFDAAKLFYNKDQAPIFEVILPMCESAQALKHIYDYYKDFVVGKQYEQFSDSTLKIADWIGEFKPAKINVIPLFEDKDNMLNAADILKDYFTIQKKENITYQRVFLARSDPAMNYGLIAAVLLNKIALSRLDKVQKSLNIPLYPIIGVGSAPFRGNLRPDTVTRVAAEYPSVYTFTIQSAFKYDYEPDLVRSAIDELEARLVLPAQEIDEAYALDLIERYGKAYSTSALDNAAIINRMAKSIPSRRKRKLHTGLFGYARSMDGVSLPRVITFTAALYSLGCPPELFGLEALTSEDLAFIKKNYINFEADLLDALKFYNPKSPCVSSALAKAIDNIFPNYESDHAHQKITSFIIDAVTSGHNGELTDLVLQAAQRRHFIG